MRTYSFVGPPHGGVKTLAAQEPHSAILRAARPRLRLIKGVGVFVGIANILLLEAVALLAILAIWYGALAAPHMTIAPPPSLVAAPVAPG